jgi:eukaryotic-like serine/threonine-protein kinase
VAAAGSFDERTGASIGDRYEIRGRLGMGGMGVVYEALDRQRGVRIALKSLRQLDATALYRFKKEFRALCDIAHPNLVELYDLFGDGDDWFFTMELVLGTTFFKYVRPAAPRNGARSPRVRDTVVPPRRRDTAPPPLAGIAPDATADLVRSTPRPAPDLRAIAFDEAQLRESMRQLAEGVCALHGAGKLHRDLKPSNVLVAEDGRVVICDFGLVRSVDAVDDHTSDDRLTGTPAYMSPEQAFNEPLTEASDWYSVGVMLYEALTGRRPHLTSSIEALRARRTAPVLAPHYLVDDIPADLEELCLDLLSSRPEDRPRGADVLARLGGDDAPHSMSAAVQSIPFVGREHELVALQEAAARVASGSPGIAFVTGASGLGKSALVRHFLETLDDESTLVLQGRCYERESVPYKALDSLVDALSTTLMGLPADWLEARLPADITALAKLFPVLKRVDLVAAPARRTIGSPDPQETRRRAFRAMRQLLGALATEHRLVLYLDDVQWGDADSAALIAELLRPPHPPPLLLVLAHRDEDEAASSFLRVFGAEIARPAFACNVTRVPVGPLTTEDAQALASALLVSRKHAGNGVAATIAGEARGNPFFVLELVHHAARPEDGTSLVLDDVLAARLTQLPADARTLLRVVAVAGKPTDFVVAATAAGLDTTATSAVATLRAQRLVRTRGSQQMMVEPYHDRVREVVASRLSAGELRDVHAQLARALELHDRGDPELLLEYRRGAGHLDEALRHALTAARNAADVLAFDRAASLYRTALDLHGATCGEGAEGRRDEARRLETQLGDALANAGRGGEAAAAYLAAANGATVSEALDLERRAAEQLIFSGRIAEGVDIIRKVLATVELTYPETPRRALVSFLLHRFKLRLRGLRHEPRDASEISPAELRKVDLCWSVAVGLCLTDNIRGNDFQTRHLLLALASGESYRISRALGLEIGYAAAGGQTKRVEKIADMAFELARRVDNPHALGLAKGSYALAAFLAGRWREAVDLDAEAEQIFRDRCTNVTWEKNTVVLFGLTALFQLGEISELCARLPRLMREAEERGNLYADVMLRVSRTNVAWLVPDTPDEAERNIAEAIDRWPKDRFVLPHYYELVSRTGIDLYRGDPERALARIEERMPHLHASYLDRVQRVRIETRIAHAGAALGVAAIKSAGERRRLLAKAERLARAVLREDAPWASGLARLVLGRVAQLRGDEGRAIEELETAAEAFDLWEMALYANVARRQRGEIIGGQEGKEAILACDERMAVHGIVRPDRFAYFLSPGCDSAAP